MSEPADSNSESSARAIAVGWELLALGSLLLARTQQEGGLQSDMLTLAWLVLGLHLWRGLTALGRAPLPPLWLVPFELAAFLGWLDPGPGPQVLAEGFLSWRGVPQALGTQPLWCFLPALVVAGTCFLRAFGSRETWLEPHAERGLRWWPRAAALAALGFVAVGVAGTESVPWGGGAGLQVEEVYSWRTGRGHRNLAGRAEGVWAEAEGLEPCPGLTLRYRAEGLLEPQVRVQAVASGRSRLLLERSLQGTSPGLVRTLLDLRPAGPLEAGETLRIEVLAKNDPRFEAALELAPAQRLQSLFALRVAHEGWLGALLTSSLAPLPLAALFLGLALVWSRWSPGPRWLLASLALVACAAWLCFAAPALRIVLGWLVVGPAALVLGLQGWVALLPFAEGLPPLLNFGPSFGAVMGGQFSPLFPGGFVSQGAQPAYLERLVGGLGRLSGAVSPGALALGVVLCGGGLVASARARGGRVGARVSTWFFVLGAVGYVLHPTWHLPTSEPNQRVLAVLLVGGLLTIWRVLRWLEDRLPAPEPAEPRAWLDPAAAALVILYVLLRIPDLLLPATFNTDECAFSSASEQVFRAQREALGLSGGLGSKLLVLAGAGGLAFALWALAKRVREFALWFVAVSALGLLAWALWVPIPDWGEMATYRYPPLAKLLPGTLGWLSGTSLSASRFWCLVASAGGGYALCLGARRLGVSRAAALGALLVFLGTNLTWYWSVFAYNTHFLVLASGLASIPLLGWIRSNRPHLLGWCALWVGVACASRITGVVTFLAVVSAVALTLVASPRHRTRANAWACALFLAALLPGIMLWQRVLVGGWFGWVGAPLSWHSIRDVMTDFDRWRLAPYVVWGMNGAWFFLILVLGVLAGCLTRRQRKGWALPLCVLLAWLGIATTITLVLGRGRSWDGLPRFVFPSLVPLSLLAGLGLNALQRRTNRWVPLIVILPILIFGREPVADPPAALPSDLNPWVQPLGRSHGFFPESLVLEQLPEGIEKEELAILHDAIMCSSLRQFDFTRIKTLEQIHGEMKRNGWRAFVIPYSPDPLVNDAIYRFQRPNSTIAPHIWQDPDSIGASPLFEAAGVATFHGVEFRIFVLSE